MVQAFLFFILTIITVPFMPSGGTVPRWAFLSIMCAVFLFRNSLSWPFLGMVAYLLLMAWVGPVGFDAAFIFWHFLLLAVLFCWAQGANLKHIAIGAGLGMAVNSGFVIGQVLGWNVIPQLVPNSGLFYNHNMGAEAAAMILALVVTYRLWWLIPGILPTLAFGSRAPILALGVAAGCVLWRWSRFAALMTTLGVTLFVVVFMQGEGGHRGVIVSADLMQRIGVWQDMLPHLTIWGHGLGSFIGEYPAFQHHTNPLELRFENAHNDFLQVTYELGLGGIVLIGVLLMRMIAAPFSPAWYALVVFLVEACFGFPLYEPVSGALAACCAGVLFAGCDSLRGLLPDRRSRVWARLAHHEFGPFRHGGAVFPALALPPLGTGLLGHHAVQHRRDPRGQGGNQP